MKTTLIIPTLNELGGMKEIMLRIKSDRYDQLIIVDGGLLTELSNLFLY